MLPSSLGALLFNAGCNEVFSPKPWRKKFGADSPSRRLGFSNNQFRPETMVSESLKPAFLLAIRVA